MPIICGKLIKAIKPSCARCSLALLLLLVAPVCTHAQLKQQMLVIGIYEGNNDGYTTIIFLRSQRKYRLPNNCKHYKKYRSLLEKSAVTRKPVTIERENERSEVIIGVGKGKKTR